MDDKIIRSLDVFVRNDYYDFFYSVFGLMPTSRAKIHIFSEDRNRVDHSVQLFTKEHFEPYPKPDDPTDESYLDRFIEGFGKSVRQLYEETGIIYGKNAFPERARYSAIDTGEEKKLELLVPSGFLIYHPADYITKDVLDEVVKKFCRDLLNEKLINVVLYDVQEDEVRERYEEKQEFRRKNEEFIARGGRWNVRMDPRVLDPMFGSNEVARFGDQIEYGFEKDGQNYVRLKDGTDHLIGPPKLDIVE